MSLRLSLITQKGCLQNYGLYDKCNNSPLVGVNFLILNDEWNYYKFEYKNEVENELKFLSINLVFGVRQDGDLFSDGRMSVFSY